MVTKHAVKILSASQLEKGQAGFLLKDPRITRAVDLPNMWWLEDLASWYFVQWTFPL